MFDEVEKKNLVTGKIMCFWILNVLLLSPKISTYFLPSMSTFVNVFLC